MLSTDCPNRQRHRLTGPPLLQIERQTRLKGRWPSAMASPMPKTSLRNVFCRARFSAIMNPFLINDEELGNQGKDTSRGTICTPHFHRCDNEKRLFRQLIEVCQILQDHTARTEPDLV